MECAPARTITQTCSSPNAIACLSCRTRHLKCDAQRPVCSRCQKCKLPCQYLQSRRGRRSQNTHSSSVQKQTHGRPPLSERASESTQQSLSDAEGSVTSPTATEMSRAMSMSFNNQHIPMQQPMNGADAFMSFSPDLWNNSGFRLGAPLDFLGSCLTPNDLPSTTSDESESNAEHLVALFYKHFYPAHPFTIPYRLYTQCRKSMPRCLDLAMQFAGSHFTSTPGQQWQQCPSTEAVPAGELEAHLHMVQALLIHAITRYGRNELQESCHVLRKASNLAMAIKLNDAATVAALSRGDKILEQSSIRTWWELVNTTAIISIFDTSDNLIPNLPGTDLPLPCEEDDFADGCVPAAQRTQKDFLDRAFLKDDFEYSSYAYKIEACRLLASLHALGNDWWSVDKDRICTVHNCISNFHLSMPLQKREIVAANDGNVDEVLFAAKMLAAVATVLINRPRSSIAGNTARPRMVRTGRLSALSFESSKQHTIQALQAANALADAAATRSSPCTVICHSPFYTCVVAVASTVHLPAYAQADANIIRESIKERLKLTTNGLSRIAENWPIAREVENQVLETIREVLSGARPTPPQEPLLPAPPSRDLTNNTIHDDWMDSFLLHGPINPEDFT